VRHLHACGVPIAVATSSHRAHFDVKTQGHTDFFGLFEAVVTGDMVAQGKPDPEVTLLCWGGGGGVFGKRTVCRRGTQEVLLFRGFTGGLWWFLRAFTSPKHTTRLPNTTPDLSARSSSLRAAASRAGERARV
jgi:hypothetical protein